MTWTFQDTKTGQSKTAGTSVGDTGFSTLPQIGDLVVVVVALDNTATTDSDSTTVSSVTDTKGNTYVKARERTNTAGGAAADGACLSIWYSNITIAWAVGNFITANHASLTARAIVTIAFSPTNANGGTLDATTAENHTDGSDPASFSLTPAGGSREYLWIYGLAAEGPSGDTDTPDSTNGWNLAAQGATSGQSAVTNMYASAGYQIATASSKTCDWTHTARDNQQLLVAFTENAAPGAGFPFDKRRRRSLIRTSL